MADPEYHFYFMGIKMIGTKMIIERLLSRASPSAFVDLIMLNKINNYESKPCFPNLTIRQGKITVYDNKTIEKKLRTICNYFHHWHDMKMCSNQLKKKIPRCDTLPHYIYKKEPERNKYTSLITSYHDKVMKYYIRKYFSRTKLLDIGAGPLRNLKFYEIIGIRNLIAIEPSKDSVQRGLEKYKNINPNMKVDLIEGYGDENWLKNNKVYDVVIKNKPYKSILLKFSIHYMIKKLDTLLNNIKNVESDNTIIIVSCLDGNLINKKLNKYNGKYEIFIEDEPLYGIYKMDPDNEYKKIMVYFKGVYGVEKGSVEYLVDINNLIEKFSLIGYRAIENKSLLNVNVPYLNKMKNKLNRRQKLVSELHKIIIFKKYNKVGVEGIERMERMKGIERRENGVYYKKYLKYKTKYLALRAKY